MAFKSFTYIYINFALANVPCYFVELINQFFQLWQGQKKLQRFLYFQLEPRGKKQCNVMAVKLKELNEIQLLLLSFLNLCVFSPLCSDVFFGGSKTEKIMLL